MQPQVHLPRRRTKKRGRVSNDDIDLIIAAYLEGYPDWEIDEALNLSAGTAERMLEDHGYKGRFRVPKREYMQYPQLYLSERWSMSRIAEKFGRSPSTIKSYLLTLGTWTDSDGKKHKIRIRHCGHRGKQGHTKKRQVH